MSFTSTDLLKLGFLCVTFVVLALLWVYRFKRDDVSWTLKTAISVSSRVIFVEGAFIAVVCYGCEVSVDGLLKLMPCVVIGLLLSNRHVQHVVPPDADIFFGSLLAAFLVTCVLPFYFLKQFVIGFPDGVRFRESVEPEVPPTSTAKSREPVVPAGTEGVVSATLRPLGKVDVDGTTYDAQHAAASLVDVGMRIIVTGHKNRTLLVKEAETLDSNEESQK